jgi:hypothetical protein
MKTNTPDKYFEGSNFHNFGVNFDTLMEREILIHTRRFLMYALKNLASCEIFVEPTL